MKSKLGTIKTCLLAAFLLILVWLPFFGQFLFFSRPNQDFKLPQVLGAKDIAPRGAVSGNAFKIFWQLKSGRLETANVKAASFLAYDAISGQALAEKSPKQKLPIASLTKLITAYVVYQNLDLNEVITITNKPLTTTSPALNLKPGDQVLALDALNAMLVGSANDAAEVLAQATEKRTKKAFVQLMNETGQSLGMIGSHFDNPLGFDSEQNYSNAEDLSKLVDAVKTLPAFKVLGRKTEYAFRSLLGNRYFINSTNKLISRDPAIYAVKTGFTETAQGSLITQDDIAGKLVVIIVIGSPEREADTLKLKSAIGSGFEIIKQ